MSEDGSIRELDGKTVERIAAGEVVERPASVVKELVENSLDADASRVSVTVESGGKDGIRVEDDGIGMSESDVRKAVEEHTTSKISDIEDLESGVATLGFRGEALHAIGAVSRLTIETRPRGGGRGTELRVEGGEVTAVEPTGCPEGTTIGVEDLFFNVPARRKYLKQDGTEFAHVNTIVTSYALANPDVAVSLEHDGRETFATTGDGNLRSAVLSVYGRDVAKGMVAVDPDGTGEGGDGSGDDTAGDLPEGPLDGVSGLVSHPETNRASREYVTTYVNGRYVRSATVRDAVVAAYGNQLAPDRYPFAVLDLSLPADTVDVNVHPRKMEVRFADAEGVAEQVRTAVEDALLREGLLRSSAPRGRSAPDQTEIAPDRGDSADEGPEPDESADHDAPETVGDDTHEKPETTPRSPIGPDDVRDADPERPAGTDAAAATEPTAATGAVDETGAGADAETGEGRETGRTRNEGVGGTTGRASDESPAGETAEGSSDGSDPTGPHDRGGRFRPGTEQARLGDGEPATGEREEFDRLPSMRVLGQYRDTYLVAETDDGLVLIDQHAADERVNYERLRERFAEGATSQALADPVELSLTAREAELFEEYEPALRRLGFRAERQDGRTVEVRTVPELVAQAAGPELIREVLSAFVTGESAAAETVDAAADDLLADLACYPSITGNTSLTEGSVVALLSALDDCENPWACPHGRPVVIEFDHGEIEDRFERDYPGHGGRE